MRAPTPTQADRSSTGAGLLAASWVALSGCSSDDERPGGSMLDASLGDGGMTDAPWAAPRDSMPPDASAEGGPSWTDASTEGGDGGNASRYPPLLSQTGLYADVASETLGEGVRAFHPAHVLWTDGATKRRWVWLPDVPIDTSDMSFWRYPEGTRLWKEFSVNGQRIETRLLHKRGAGAGDWVMVAYLWLEDGSDAVAVPDGAKDASGTDHDVPSREDCQSCHGNMADRALGFSALQLSPDRDPGAVPHADG